MTWDGKTPSDRGPEPSEGIKLSVVALCGFVTITCCLGAWDIFKAVLHFFER